MSLRHGNTHAAQRQFYAAAAQYDNANPYADATHARLEQLDEAVRLDRDAMLECVNEAVGDSATAVCTEALLQLRDSAQALRRVTAGEPLNAIQAETLRGLAARANEVWDAVENEIGNEVARRFERRDAA